MQRVENSDSKVLLGMLLILVVSAGCRAPANVPALDERSLMSVKLAIETEPRGARVFTEDLRLMGEAPVTHVWRLEKLAWSDGRTDFRMLPKGTRIEPGEELSARLTLRAQGYKEKTTIISVPFSGKEETIARKITLENK